ncbi:hypothetical protein OKA05_28600 [Luteolibacter arcticus]|uniref:CHAT domain-containing protein n=1 Tax=Luteolibacter arcticus TaxID=1581411 RepID=A0ABT3GSS9_9BACT|nr:hypothetical protein [Luteolibacter arcticus]MCW1926546.1 hypothetical protein [Luteolibacter arcticus]
MDPLKTAICIHAQSADLKFLNRVRNRIEKVLRSQVRSFRLDTHESNSYAMGALKSSVEGVVVIMAHGGADYLRGGEYSNRETGQSYEVERFIKRDQMDVLSGKVIFCMSCDSNELAEAALEAGAIAFVGFDEIPFDRFDAAGEAIGGHVLVKHCQEKLIAPAIIAALERFFSGRATLDEAVEFLKLWIAKSAVAYVRKYTKVKERREVAALFLKVRSGIRYHGPLGIRFQLEPTEE